MTRKDYIVIARAIKNASSLEDLAHRLADYMQVDNPAFHRARFLGACGLLIRKRTLKLVDRS